MISDNDFDQLCADISDLQLKHVGNTEFGDLLIRIAKQYYAMAKVEGEFDDET